MNKTNRKIIDAVIARAEKVCPGSVALIGIYGSAATGDVHDKSDLDLLILINDEGGYRLNNGFILDDTGIAYDIYCTSWGMLEGDAECRHAHLSKLMDSVIVHVADPAAPERLDGLKKKAAGILASDVRFDRARESVDQARIRYANAMTARSLGEMRLWAAAFIATCLDAVMLWNGRYFRRGTKRTFEELAGLDLPLNFAGDIESMVRAKDSGELGGSMTSLLRSLGEFTKHTPEKSQPSAENIAGTYEEMYSNWKNKLPEAAANGDVYSSFMNLAFFGFMLSEIAEGVDIRVPELMGQFDPDDLAGNAAVFDSALEDYLEEYRKAGISPVRFSDADAFVAAYLETDEK